MAGTPSTTPEASTSEELVKPFVPDAPEFPRNVGSVPRALVVAFALAAAGVLLLGQQ